jgi:hypothetical protein
MPSNILPVLAVVFIVLLCVVAYFPLTDRLAQSDIAALTYGAAVRAMVPLLLTAFACAFSLIVIVLSSKQATGENQR